MGHLVRGYFVMKKEFSDRIGKAIGDRRDAIQNAATAKDQLADAEQQFVSEFYAVCDETIKPAMQEVSDILTAQDYRCTIELMDESSTGSSRSPGGITLTVYNQPKQKDVDDPHFTVECDKVAQKIKFHEGTIGSAMGGSLMDAGEASFADISADLIHDKLATWITNLFESKPSGDHQRIGE
jgi:hypothetical protein